ncbi:MAG: CBS domain-containing protein [Bacteroidota bacterium]|nr:CBS domain-containing protein [Bacteroidota bacterium]
MIASSLMDLTIHPVGLNTKVKEALQEMERERVYHLPVVEKGILVGIVSEQVLRDTEPEFLIAQCPLLKSVFSKSNDHFFSIWSTIAKENLSSLPVINQEGEYMGCVTQETMMQFYARSFALSEPGSIIVLSTRKMDYSLSKIAQIAEDQRCIILSCFVSEQIEEGNILITLKVNCQDTENLVNAFNRYEFEVVSVLSEEDFPSLLKDRYNELMNYLNV